jgi:hypothetical protein
LFLDHFEPLGSWSTCFAGASSAFIFMYATGASESILRLQKQIFGKYCQQLQSVESCHSCSYKDSKKKKYLIHYPVLPFGQCDDQELFHEKAFH